MADSSIFNYFMVAFIVVFVLITIFYLLSLKKIREDFLEAIKIIGDMYMFPLRKAMRENAELKMEKTFLIEELNTLRELQQESDTDNIDKPFELN